MGEQWKQARSEDGLHNLDATIRARSVSEKYRVAPSTIARLVRRGGGDTLGTAPPRLSLSTREIRLIPSPMEDGRNSLTTRGGLRPLREMRWGGRKHAPPGFVGGALVCLHRVDP